MFLNKSRLKLYQLNHKTSQNAIQRVLEVYLNAP